MYKWFASTTQYCMRLCRFGNGRLGVVNGDALRDVTAALDVLPELSASTAQTRRPDRAPRRRAAGDIRDGSHGARAAARRRITAQPRRQPGQADWGASQLPETPGGSPRQRRPPSQQPDRGHPDGWSLLEGHELAGGRRGRHRAAQARSPKRPRSGARRRDRETREPGRARRRPSVCRRLLHRSRHHHQGSRRAELAQVGR